VSASFYFYFKGTPSLEKNKTGFSVLTTIELNLPVEFTKMLQTTATVQ
jgi:hypothetical protein